MPAVNVGVPPSCLILASMSLIFWSVGLAPKVIARWRSPCKRVTSALFFFSKAAALSVLSKAFKSSKAFLAAK